MATDMSQKKNGKRGWLMLAGADVVAILAIFVGTRAMLPELEVSAAAWMAFLAAQVLVAVGLLFAGIGESIREAVNRDRDMNPANEA